MATTTRAAGIAATQNGKRIEGQRGALAWLERALWLAWIPLVLYVVFFSPIPDIHDGMHPIRHSSTLVQCH